MISTHSEHPDDCLTLKEAALLAGVTEKAIRHEVAEHVAKPHRTRGGLRFCEREVLFFRLLSALPFEIKKADRRDLFDVVTLRASSKGLWTCADHWLRLGGAVPAEMRLTQLAREVGRLRRLLLNGKRRVVSRGDVLGGEPVFEGTRISVRHVGELVKRGLDRAELHEDFPSLKDSDFEFARMFVELGRPRGRPKKLKFVRASG